MSEGLMSSIERTTPSTTTSGLLEDSIPAPPRRTMVGALPGEPEVLMTRKPLTDPCNAVAALATAAFSSVLLSSFEIEVVKVERFCLTP